MPHSLTEPAGLSASAEDFPAAVLETAAQPIWVFDPDDVIRFANPAAITARRRPALNFPYSADEALDIRRVQDAVGAFCGRMPNPVHAGRILRAAQSDEALAAHDAQLAEHTRS